MEKNFFEQKNINKSETKRDYEDWEQDYGYILDRPEIEKDPNSSIIILSFVRHGEKGLSTGAETPLTNRGVFESALNITKRLELNNNKHDKVDSFNIEYSRSDRTAQGAEIGQLVKDNNIDMYENDNLYYENMFSEDFTKKILNIKKDIIKDNLIDKGISPDILENILDDKLLKLVHVNLSSTEQAAIDQQAGNLQLRKFLPYEDKKPDEGTSSPKEFASKLAKVVKSYVEESLDLENNNKYKPDSVHNVLSFTHDIHIASFLYFLNEEYKNNFIEDSDNNVGIKFGEGFDVIVKNQTKDDLELVINFRGKNFPVDIDNIIELVNYEQ